MYNINIDNVSIAEEKKIDELSERKKVMIVDDYKPTVFLLSQWLSKSYSTIVGYDGHEALTKIKVLKERYNLLPDFILLDIDMPGIKGHEVCKILKSNPEYSQIPIYFFSALPSERLGEIMADSEANGYFEKPGEIPEIIDKIKEETSEPRHKPYLVSEI